MANAEKSNRITLLKARTNRCCCRYCGGALEVRQIIFYEQKESRIEIFCQDCDRIEFGVEKEIYKSACHFVDEAGFNHYPDLDDNEKAKQMNIAKICDIIAWGCQSFGFLSNTGFSVPVAANQDLQGKSMTLNEATLLALLGENGL